MEDMPDNSDATRLLDELEASYEADTTAAWDTVPRIPIFRPDVRYKREWSDPNQRYVRRLYGGQLETEELLHDTETAKRNLRTVRDRIQSYGSFHVNRLGLEDLGVEGRRVVPYETMQAELKALEARRSYSRVNGDGRIEMVMEFGGKLHVLDQPAGEQRTPVVPKKSLAEHIPGAEQLSPYAESDEGLSTPAPTQESPDRSPAGLQLSTSEARFKQVIRYDYEDFERPELLLQKAKSREAMERVRRRDVHALSPMDANHGKLGDRAGEEAMLRFYKANPINRMIAERTVAVVSIRHPEGRVICFEQKHRELLTLEEALRVADLHGLDVIQVGTFLLDRKPNELGLNGNTAALVVIDDHVAFANNYLEYDLPRHTATALVKECFEVGFRGGTHAHAIKFKTRYIADYLFHQHPVRIALKDFGTAREGFPVFETILAAVKRECLHFKSWHSTSRVNATYDEISCYLHPAGESNAKEIRQPAQAELNLMMERRLLEEQQEIYVDNYGHVPRAGLPQYWAAVAHGTAWSYRDPGLSLRDQRRMKVRLGWIPKSNDKIYSRRGDVDLPTPFFRASSATRVDSVMYPRQSNLEQATAGAAVIGKRYDMAVEDMFDENELPGEASSLSKLWYRTGGDAIQVGDLKRALGLKRNYKERPPRYTPGFATMGMKEPSGVQGSYSQHI